MKALSLSYILFVLSIGTACSNAVPTEYRPQRSGSVNFQDLLHRGKSPLRLEQEKAANLGLNGFGLQSSLSVSNIDSQGQYSSHIQFDTMAMPSIENNRESILSYIESFLNQNAGSLQVAYAELIPADQFIQKLNNNLHVVSFNRTKNKLLVDNARVQFFFYEVSGQLVLARVNNHSYGAIIDINGSPELSKQIDFDSLTGIPGVKKLSQENLIYAVNEGNGYSFHYGSRVKVAKNDDSEIFHILLNNSDESIIEAYSNKVHAAHTLEVEKYKRSYVFKDKISAPFALVGVDNTETDQDGKFDTDAATAQITLASTNSASGIVQSGANNFFSFPVTLQGNKTLIKPDQTNEAAINTFVAIHDVAQFVGQFLTAAQAPILQTGIQANVNIADSCNAFFDGNRNTLNFFQEGTAGNGSTCSNTSLINDIIYHEWGHALDFQVGTTVNNITDGAFSEGIGDIISALVTDSPNLAPGFFLNNTNGIRQLRNDIVAPPQNEAEAEVHFQGQIIGGAFWDLKKMMEAKYGPIEGTRKVSEMFFQHLRITDVYTDSYRNLLTVNDDDANPNTPSPDYCLINKAFARHNISDSDAAEGVNCVDEDELLRFNISAEKADKITLDISALGAQKIIMCTDTSIEDCDIEDPNNFIFEKTEIEGYIGNRQFYTTQAEIDLSSTRSVLLVTTDIYDNIITKKQITFNERDRSNDLSHQLQ